MRRKRDSQALRGQWESDAAALELLVGRAAGWATAVEVRSRHLELDFAALSSVEGGREVKLCLENAENVQRVQLS